MFRDMLRSNRTTAELQVRIRAVGKAHRITVNGRLWEPGAEQTVYDQLVYVLMRASLDVEPDLLHIHAAYVAFGGRGLLVAGLPGSGKSTLVARMLAYGFDYLTDERVGIDGHLRVHPLPKPISLVKSSFEVLPHLDPHVSGAGVASPLLWHVPASAIRAGSVIGDALPAALAFVEYRHGSSVTSTELHPAEAVRLLLADSVDAARFGAASVPLVAALCASLRCVRVVFGDDDDIMSALRNLLAAPSAPAAPQRVTRVGVAATAVPSWPASRSNAGSGTRARLTASSAPRLRSDVSGVVVRRRAVLHVGAAGKVIELDEAATAWLLLLDGEAPVERLAAEVAEANDLAPADVRHLALGVLGRLAELGVVE